MSFLNQLTLGSIIMALTVVIHAAVLLFMLDPLRNLAGWLRARVGRGRQFVVFLTAVAGVIAVTTVEVWIWAGAFIVTGAIEGLEPAVYFALISYTTLGYGDLVLSVDHRIFGGFSAAAGLLNFGLTTAFLMEVLRELIGRTDNLNR